MVTLKPQLYLLYNKREVHKTADRLHCGQERIGSDQEDGRIKKGDMIYAAMSDHHERGVPMLLCASGEIV
ncbi:hypothetical protein KSX_84280 [Ktedonospora formicarum]|uniref:Uncharacterized protein n=1 Tax=Ktedonospora formicarum TaxID=2778364 RepID=A0A8J3IBJ7_9CHLR|nr:hypothetical protein KSX_84280 [Ktedonospora formicarum]